MNRTTHEPELERASSTFAAKASAEAVSLEKSMFLVWAFARLEALAEGRSPIDVFSRRFSKKICEPFFSRDGFLLIISFQRGSTARSCHLALLFCLSGDCSDENACI